MTLARQIYVLSDLHLGGAPPDAHAADEANRRGFRMMRHPDKLADFVRTLAERAGGPEPELVINGDFVDFLAEPTAPDQWIPFRFKPDAALKALETIMGRKDADGPVFDALGTFVKKGHRLTLLLGNHDLELALPEVRAALARRLGGPIQWLVDGEALQVGDVLIEHGNNYDPANAVDHDGLRRLRALRSRRQFEEEVQGAAFEAPMGSQLVATIMNPLKRRYAFVDLLKPESEPLFALILAIAPEMRREVEAIVELLPALAARAMPVRGVPAYLRNVSGGDSTAARDKSSLVGFLEQAVPSGVARDLAGAPAAAAQLQNVGAAAWLIAKLGLFRAFFDGSAALSDSRLDALRLAFMALNEDETWEKATETGKRYKNAATKLMDGSTTHPGFRHVIFGHTHHAKQVELKKDKRYVNTGTWANLMRFPRLDADRARAIEQLRDFTGQVERNELEGEFLPTYARIDERADGSVESPTLCTYDSAAKKVE